MILLRPVDPRFPITQNYGENPDLYPLTGGHNGIDYGVPVGTLIRAAHDGQIARADVDAETLRNSLAGYGLHVRIQGSECLSIYGHMDGVTVKMGEWVRVGQIIGTSGNTGRSTGPHLHFEVRTGLAYTNVINPSLMIKNALEDMSGLFDLELTPAGDGLRVRNAPISGGVIRNLKPGERVRVIGVAEGSWLQTEQGWIMYKAEWLKVAQ
jgi:hypothetical protein